MRLNKLIAKILIVVMLATTLINGNVIEAYAAADLVFEEMIKDFPDSYKQGLREVHAVHQNWIFVPDKTGLTWKQALAGESDHYHSLIQNNSDSSWKAARDGDYDWTNKTWTEYDGKGTANPWVAASDELVQYYMDPRNFIKYMSTGNQSIFMFMDQSFDEDTQTKERLQTMLKGSFMEGNVSWEEAESLKSLGAAAEQIVYEETSDIEKATDTDAIATESVIEESTEENIENIAEDVIEEAIKDSTEESAEKIVEAEEIEDKITELEQAATESNVEISAEEIEENEETIVVENVAGEDSEIAGELESETDSTDAAQTGAEQTDATQTDATPAEATEEIIEAVEITEAIKITEVDEATDAEAKTETVSAEEIINEIQITELNAERELQVEEVEDVLGSDKETITKSYEDIIMEAAKVSGVNPFVLAASIFQEQGKEKGYKPMISGDNEQYPGIYNYYNHGAYDTADKTSLEKGLEYANTDDPDSLRPWNTPEKAIIGGAKLFADNYISKGQNTLYYKKFNLHPKNTTNKVFSHQYMTNIAAAAKEGVLLGTGYEKMEIQDSAFTFIIPVFIDIDKSTPVSKPTGTGDPDYRLSTITVNGEQIPKVSYNTYTYSKTLPNNTSTATITATSIANTASVNVNGSGKSSATISLSKGEKKSVSIVITAQNGNKKTYTVNVSRESGGSSSGSGSGGSGSGGSGSGGSGSGGSGGSPSGGPGSGTAGGTTAPQMALGTDMILGADGLMHHKRSSENWFQDNSGKWKIKNNAGQIVTNAWLCDDVVLANGQNVWYLLGADGTMVSAGLVQDNTGNFYSLESSHNGYFGMLRYQNGYYDCNGVQVYLEFNQNHNGSFAAITNPDGIAKLQQIYGLTQFGIGNDQIVRTITFGK